MLYTREIVWYARFPRSAVLSYRSSSLDSYSKSKMKRRSRTQRERRIKHVSREKPEDSVTSKEVNVTFVCLVGRFKFICVDWLGSVKL